MVVSGEHSAGRDVRTETEPMRLEKIVELIEDNPGADANTSLVEIEIVDLAIVPREIDDQSFANRIPNEAGAGPPRRDGNVRIGGVFDDGSRFPSCAWKRNAPGLDLINRGIGGVKLAG